MPFDPEIFGAASKGKSDSDIFKDVGPAKAEASAPVIAAKPASPGEAAIQRLRNEGWGTGLPKAMYDIGGKVAETTGLPSLGAAVSVIPDAIQMALGGAVGRTAAPAFDWAGRWLMRSALKPTLEQAKKGRAAPAVQTMLDEGFSPVPGGGVFAGVEDMKSRLSDLGSQVDKAVAKSGATIDAKAVADYVPNAYKRFQNGPLAVPAIEDLGKVQTTFLEHPNIAGVRDIPVQVAQDTKTGYQRAIGDKGYDVLKTPTTEGEKQIARGLRELIGQAVPDVSAPLARESAIINALKMAERRVAIDANKNPLGIGALISQPWMVPYWLWDRSALGKSLAARALYSGQEQIPANIGRVGGALYGSQQDRGALYTP